MGSNATKPPRVTDITPPGVDSPLDFCLRRRYGLWPVLLIFMLCAVVIQLPIGYFRIGIPPQVSGVLPIIVGFCLLELLARRRNARVRRRVRELPTAEPREFARIVAECLAVLPRTAITAATAVAPRGFPAVQAAVSLANAGLPGRIVRFTATLRPLGALAPPFDVPFEPIPASIRDPGFQALTGVEFRRASLIRQNIRRSMEALGDSRIARWFVVGSMILSLCMLPFGVYWSIREILMGQLPSMLTGVVAISPLILLVLLLRVLRQEQWLLVPGAVLVRYAGALSGQWRLRLLARAESTIVYWADLNFIAIAARDGAAFGRFILPAEAEGLMRAWLSPLEPPPVERLSDLV